MQLNREEANNLLVNGHSGAKQGGFPAYQSCAGRGERGRRILNTKLLTPPILGSNFDYIEMEAHKG